MATTTIRHHATGQIRSIPCAGCTTFARRGHLAQELVPDARNLAAGRRKHAVVATGRKRLSVLAHARSSWIPPKPNDEAQGEGRRHRERRDPLRATPCSSRARVSNSAWWAGVATVPLTERFGE